MSGLGRERVIATVNGFDEDDFKTVLELIPEELLWDELRERGERKNKIINEISRALNINLEVNMVRVNEDYIIDIDSYNYTVKLDQHKKIQVKDKTSGEYVSVDSFKTVGYYKDMSQAIRGIIEDTNRRELSAGSFTLEEALKIILKNNNKVSELLDKVLEV